jgi:hypothetical protein
MAFLDNSGDIILDAVLTDTGRARLAKGDGSFKITKFALGDDEIDYALYDKDHPSGSAYFDLEIMQTPVLEAFTNNTSTMKSKLISISRTNLLYLPVVLLNENTGKGATRASNNIFYIAVNDATENTFSDNALWTQSIVGSLLFGANPAKGTTSWLRLDQGLNTTEISPALTLDPDLVETQYIIEMDNRFGSIVDINNNAAAVSFIDDDQVASYYLSRGTDPAFVENTDQQLDDSGVDNTQVISGPKGTILKFKIRSSLELTTSDYLFQQLGVATTLTDSASGTQNVYQIDSTIRVTGATTGYRVDIPVRFIRNR